MCCYHHHACFSVCLSLVPACLSVKLQWMIQVTRATLEFKSSGCAVSNKLIYDSSLSQNYIVCTLPLSAGGFEPPTRFKNRGLDRTSTFRGGYWERGGGGDFFQRGCNCHIKNK